MVFFYLQTRFWWNHQESLLHLSNLKYHFHTPNLVRKFYFFPDLEAHFYEKYE